MIFSRVIKNNLPTEPADHREMYNWLSSLSDQELFSELQSVKDLAKASKYPEGTTPAWVSWKYAAITELLENRKIADLQTEGNSSERLR